MLSQLFSMDSLLTYRAPGGVAVGRDRRPHLCVRVRFCLLRADSSTKANPLHSAVFRRQASFWASVRCTGTEVPTSEKYKLCPELKEWQETRISWDRRSSLGYGAAAFEDDIMSEKAGLPVSHREVGSCPFSSLHKTALPLGQKSGFLVLSRDLPASGPIFSSACRDFYSSAQHLPRAQRGMLSRFLKVEGRNSTEHQHARPPTRVRFSVHTHAHPPEQSYSLSPLIPERRSGRALGI